MTTDQKPAAEFPPRVIVDVDSMTVRLPLGEKGKGNYLSRKEHEVQLESVTRERDDEKKNYQECLKTLNAVSSANRELNAQLENTRELLKMLYEQLPTWFVLQDADWKRLRKELGE